MSGRVLFHKVTVAAVALISGLSTASAAQNADRDTRPDQEIMAERVKTIRQQLVAPVQAQVHKQLDNTPLNGGPFANSAPLDHYQIPPIDPDRLVIETFVSTDFTDQTVSALCALQKIDANISVPVEHRNYVLLKGRTKTPSLSQSTECLDHWHAKTDFGGAVMKARGVPALPYFAAHFHGSTVQGDLSSFRFKISQLVMQYGLN